MTNRQNGIEVNKQTEMKRQTESKQIIRANIISNDEIAADIFRMLIDAPQIARGATPGQFVNLYTGHDALLLPRPLGIADVEGDKITLVYSVVGKGTRLFSELHPGEAVRILGPNGNGFVLPDQSERPAKVLLVGGGLGIPPLLFAARRLREIEQLSTIRQFVITGLLGFRDEPFFFTELEALCDGLYTISETLGESRGTVIDLLGVHASSISADLSSEDTNPVILTCGPKPMLRAVCGWAAPRNMTIQVSMEERMGCGTGACVGCTCRIKGDAGQSLSVKVCTDGPVFDGSNVIWQ